MKICVIGLGHIGLPTSAMFAKHGAEVVGIDINPDVVEMLNQGKIYIEEPGLEEVVKKVVEEGRFRASLEPEEADAFIISVPTPNNEDEYKSCDLTYVLNATKRVLSYTKPGNVIIIESTIAPRSIDDYVRPLVEKAGFKVGEDVYLAHCPERVLPGSILKELVYNNRIIGGATPTCALKGAKVYKTFVQGEIILTDAKTAEMSKLMENTFRDVNIALSNELTKICNSLGINVLDVIKMANKHPRVNLHQPGPGVGGHCLAVDPYFIVAKTPELAGIINLSRKTNSSMPHYVVQCIRELLHDIEKPKVAVFGAAYKADVDDMRESPAMEVISILTQEGFEISIHDPHIKSGGYHFVSAEEAAAEAHLLLVLTDHSEFKKINYNSIASKMANPLLFDTRNCLSPEMICSMQIVNFGNLHKRIEAKKAVLV
ncbi:nucleotide sugar dehydrogenase [Paenibacillus sp. MER TA 81-3]|uniref:nucleotide sugar dehydrogenase n=1 Tax=Paenibacillus sp. MER TA 81-3 TaxID=2939573 RepID=UPI002041F1FB|nr:nucleotide sugar dehydrogenase [Paenibacillus sp. MER TA 81-3]MCM3338767.1 nucleotide sugar dehydrogenase [Paenibacillus sp. MER TA 81-3]